MILNPVIYSSVSSALVLAYNSLSNPLSEYWNEDAANPIRKEIKDHYIREQGHLCCYCGILNPSNHGADWTAEHVVPKKLHPVFLFTTNNIAVSCRECNQAKADKETLVDPLASTYPMSSDEFFVVHPHFDAWSDHIVRVEFTYAALSKKGSWTIKACKLNRFEGRQLTLNHAISDKRFEEPLERFRTDGSTLELQEIINRLSTLVHTGSVAASDNDLTS